jgi:hypothetical protein
MSYRNNTNTDDVEIVATIGTTGTRYATVNQTSWKFHYNTTQSTVRWDTLFDSGAETVVGMTWKSVVGTDETHTVGFGDAAAEYTVFIQATATTNGRYWSGWTEYKPGTPSGVNEFQFASKNSNGVNSCTAEAPVLYLGVRR